MVRATQYIVRSIALYSFHVHVHVHVIHPVLCFPEALFTEGNPACLLNAIITPSPSLQTYPLL